MINAMMILGPVLLFVGWVCDWEYAKFGGAAICVVLLAGGFFG